MAVGYDYWGGISMPDVGTWAKLAAYVVSIGLGLELAHRIYWRIYRNVMHGNMRPAVRAVAGSLSASIPLVTVLGVTAIFCIGIDRQSFDAIGLSTGIDAAALFICGAAVAVICVTILFVACCWAGIFRAQKQSICGERAPAFVGGMADFLLCSIFEEIIVRGYVFWVILNAWGPTAAVVGSAAVFSSLHVIKHPKIPVMFTINAVIFGLITGQARLITGSLWVPIGLHLGWNLAMGPMFGMPCSGRTYDSGLVCCAVKGPDWLTGGLYSPDAGVLGSATLAITTLAMMMLVPFH